MNKLRLDVRIAQLYPLYSKTQIQAWIKEGKVTVDGTIVTKPGMLISEHALLFLDVTEPKYVSRAGLKLEKALEHFKIDVANLVALDAGLSTGGFTDCLLQHGVAKVYGIDVGHGQVHEKIKDDPRVVVMEKTNLRTLEHLPSLDTSVFAKATPDTSDFAKASTDTRDANLLAIEWNLNRDRAHGCKTTARGEYFAEQNVSNHACCFMQVDIVTLDLSFISVLKVMDAVVALLKPHGKLIVLIKPQFEAGPEHVGKGGIIKDVKVHKFVLDQVISGIMEHGFVHQGTIESPILGTDGNKEFLAYFIKQQTKF